MFELKEKKADAVEAKDYGAAKDLKAEIDDLKKQITEAKAFTAPNADGHHPQEDPAPVGHDTGAGTGAAARASSSPQVQHEQPSVHHTNAVQELQIRHPHCFSDRLFQDSANSDMNRRELHPIKTVGKYRLIGRNLTAPSVKYDHQCPYFLKDRYNCARKDILGYGDNPTDWKLTLVPQQQTSNTGECNLWEFVHELGGPAGVADAKSNPSSMNEQRKKGPFIVLMMGNSYLRQLFEALACGWSSDITDYRATVNSRACYSLACMEKMKEQEKKTYDEDEVGDVTSLLAEVKSCLAGEPCQRRNKSSFYRHGVALPINAFTKRQTDNMAMVEFANSIQFYYMFRPYLHSNLTSVFEDKFGLDPADVDVLLFNNDADKTVANHNDLIRIFKSTGAWQARSLWPYEAFKPIQQRDIGKWFGADNPWITHPPDSHGCMPGVPDDEVNLFMFLLFSNAAILGDIH